MISKEFIRSPSAFPHGKRNFEMHKLITGFNVLPPVMTDLMYKPKTIFDSLPVLS